MKASEEDLKPLRPAAKALVEVARQSLGAMSLLQQSRGLARVTARLAKGRPGRVTPWAVAGLGACVVAATVFAGRSWLAHPAPLSYAVEGGTLGADGSLGGGEGDVRPTYRFSDGTEVQIGKGALAHVASVTEQGATVLLDQGEVYARVIHWAGARWLFDAGPFVVTVTGTAFALTWTPNDGRLDLRLENGSVAVSGPVSDQPIALRGGQWLTIRLQQREVLIRDLATADSTRTETGSAAPQAALPPPANPPQELGSGPDPAPDPAIDARGASSTDTVPQHEPAVPKRDWAGWVTAGKFEEIVSDANRWGLDACLAEASSGELGALADAARYTKRGSLAKRALVAQRKRFGGSRRAAEAAFLLGRVAEGQEGPAAALSWFEKYLSEAPGGAYASEALGRRMTLIEKTSGREAASVVAQEYLRRFPSGTYARAARALIQAP